MMRRNRLIFFLIKSVFFIDVLVRDAINKSIDCMKKIRNLLVIPSS